MGRVGRPKEFDREVALMAAVETFWEKGYDGTSVQDLVDSMGIHRASLYDTYGSKQDLFREVLERYSAHLLDTMYGSLDAEPDVRETLGRFFDGFAEALCSSLQKGCLVVKTVVALGEELPATREQAAAHTAKIDRRFADLLRIGQRRGEIPRAIDADSFARHLRNTLYGLLVSAAVRRDPGQLREIVRWSLAPLGR